MFSRGYMLAWIAGLFLVIDTYGHITRAYVTTPNIDISTHLLFGAWLALFFIYRNDSIERSWVFAYVLLFGLGWELFEYIYDHLYAIPHHVTLAQHGIGDTTKDIIDNSIGALVSIALFKKPTREREPTELI